MNFTIDKIIKIVSLLGANGPGASNAQNSETASGSWLTEVLAWLGNAIIQVATVVWGWLISIFYFVVKFCLNLIDILQMFVEKLVGIDAFNQEGGLSAVKSLEETDLIIKFITNDVVINVFKTIAILGLILLIIFSIIALIKQNYTAATTDGNDGVKNPREVLKKAGKAIFMCLLVPFLLVFGLLGSNAVLASVCNAIKGDNNLTIGGLIFTASAYEANKFREYATDGLRVPITVDSATEVVHPGDYTTIEDMQVLFYKLVKGDIYISYVSDSTSFQQRKESDFSQWINDLDVRDIEVSTEHLTGNTKFNKFSQDFLWFYDKYCEGSGLGTNQPYPLAELSGLHPIIKSIYNSNWTRNKTQTSLVYDFSSTYKTQSEVVFGNINNTPLNASIIVNSDSYMGYEDFATMELEYFVMADLLDFAVEQGATFYYVNANNPAIIWSDIDLEPDDEDNEHINIEEYNDRFLIAKATYETGDYFYATPYTSANINSLSGVEKTVENYAKERFGENVSCVADSAFVVRYYNGVNRLYWSADGTASESDGSTYVICVKQDDRFIPVTQTTTNFKSSFLAEDYGGPIVARGIFKTENLIPKDYCLPTEITEQKVDDYGNELASNLSQTSPFSLSDTYENPENALTIMGEFCGTIGKLGATGASLLGKALNSAGGDLDKWKASITNDMATYLNEGNVLINPNIAGFSYGAGNTITFYDKLGRKMTPGVNFAKSDSTEFAYTVDADSATPKGKGKTAYVVLQKSILGDTVIPWYFSESSNLAQIMATIIRAETKNRDYTFLLAEYTYDNIEVELELKTKIPGIGSNPDIEKITYNVLLNFNITNITQLQIAQTEEDSNKSTFKSITKPSGEFIVTDSYGVVDGAKIYVEKKADLVVSGGEIFYSNGTSFFSKEDAKKLYEDFATNYILDSLGLRTNIFGMFSKSQSEEFYSEFLAMVSKEAPIDSTNKEKTVSAFMASDLRAGLSASIKEYGKTYYSIDQEITSTADGKDNYSGSIKFYNPNNQEIKSEEIKFDAKEKVNDYTITQQVCVVSAPNSNNISYATVMNPGSDYKFDLGLTASGSKYLDKFISENGNVATKEGLISELGARTYYYYNVTYNLSFDKYINEGKTVAILGVKLNDVEVKPKEGYSNTYLEAKNNGVYSPQLGKYVLTTSGAKNYMASANETSGGIKLNLSKQGSTDSKSFKNAGLSEINAKTLNIKTQASYNNNYIYFIRGDFNWSFLMDFCIGLPTISWSPFQIRFVFRFKMGATYKYFEDVIYRLQGGAFTLDYNFRHANGIGISYLYRMSSINPFILIFSTVLVLTIIWNTVWGLIRRIYDIVLLFIMLPAVCSTMPIDDGGRFKKWKDEVVEQVLKAYSVLITLNLYFVLVPIIKEVTSNLITMGDIPSTVKGIFGAVSMGATNFMGNISAVGTKLGTLFGNVISNVGINSLVLDQALTSAQQALLNHVNVIVYIMFFLVLTTMLKNGQGLIEKILDIGHLEDGVAKEAWGNAMKVANTVKNNPATKLATKGAKLAGGLALGAAGKVGGKLLGALRNRRGEQAANNLNGNQTQQPANMAENPQQPTNRAEDVSNNSQSQTNGNDSNQNQSMEVVTNESNEPIANNNQLTEGRETPALDTPSHEAKFEDDGPIIEESVPYQGAESGSSGGATTVSVNDKNYVPSDEELKADIAKYSDEEIKNMISAIESDAELKNLEGSKKTLEFMKQHLENKNNQKSGDEGSEKPTNEAKGGETSKGSQSPNGNQFANNNIQDGQSNQTSAISSNQSPNQASASQQQPISNIKNPSKVKKVAKVAGVAAAVTAGAFVAPAGAVLATVGGVLAYKGAKKGVNKINASEFGQNVKSFVGKHPKAIKFAKNAAIIAAAGPVVGVGVIAGGKLIKKKFAKKSSGKKSVDKQQQNEIESLKQTVKSHEKEIDQLKNQLKAEVKNQKNKDEKDKNEAVKNAEQKIKQSETKRKAETESEFKKKYRDINKQRVKDAKAQVKQENKEYRAEKRKDAITRVKNNIIQSAPVKTAIKFKNAVGSKVTAVKNKTVQTVNNVKQKVTNTTNTVKEKIVTSKPVTTVKKGVETIKTVKKNISDKHQEHKEQVKRKNVENAVNYARNEKKKADEKIEKIKSRSLKNKNN